MRALRVLIYSSGLGGAYSTLTIASHLSNVCPNSSFLVLTDLSIFGRLRLPANLDYVHLPGMSDGMRKLEHIANGMQSAPVWPVAPSKLEWKSRIRQQITLATAASFDPDLVIVERFPLGLTGDMIDTLMCLRARHPGAKIVLGLWDVPEAGDVTAWEQTEIQETLRSYYDEIWVYGTPEIFDPVQAYALPVDIARKIVYTGYLRHEIACQDPQGTLTADGINLDHPFVLVTTAEENGYPLVDNYLCFLERANDHIKFQSHIVYGPLMSAQDKNSLEARAKRIPGVSIQRFHKDLSAYVDLARVVVSTGDYSTYCQNLSFRKQAIIVPRQDATADQLLRAQAFHQHGVVEMIHPTQLTPERLGQKILGQMGQAQEQGQLSTQSGNYNAFPLSGLDSIAQRVMNLCSVSKHRYTTAH